MILVVKWNVYRSHKGEISALRFYRHLHSLSSRKLTVTEVPGAASQARIPGSDFVAIRLL